MPVNTLKKLFQVQLGTSDGLVYTCPPLTRATIVSLYVTDTDTVDRTFRLHQVNSAGASTAANSLYYDHPITNKRTIRDGGIVLEPGQMMRGLASAATAVTVTGFGIETTEAG
jgi:hypothetical protein